MTCCPITRADWERGAAHCLNKGRVGNARVYRLETATGTFVVKDFRKSPWWVRWTWGRWMIGHEFRLMRMLEELPGVPSRVFRIDAYAFAMPFVKGWTLGEINQNNLQAWRERMRGVEHPTKEIAIPVTYFRALERTVCAMHRRGIVHLDLRNAKNLIVTPGRVPVLLDFQSGIRRQWWVPRWAWKILCLADLSSVYKHYYHFYFMPGQGVPCISGGFPKSRDRLFLKHLKLRKLWMLKGYTFMHRRKPKDYEQALIDAASGGGH